jgi:hypothetical protein
VKVIVDDEKGFLILCVDESTCILVEKGGRIKDSHTSPFLMQRRPTTKARILLLLGESSTCKGVIDAAQQEKYHWDNHWMVVAFSKY